jgi:NAD+ synthase
MNPPPFNKNILHIPDIASACAAIEKKLHEVIFNDLRRTGAIIGISGGIDSSVCFALATRVCGKKKVTGIMLPEKDSSPDSSELAQKLADKLGVENIITENITGALEGFGCYERRDAAVSYIFPEYDPSTHKMKIGIQGSGLFTTSLPFSPFQ